MGFKKFWEKKMKRFGVYDYAVLKIAVALVGIVIGAYISAFVKQYIWWFVIVWAVLYAYLLHKVFGK